ncbi:ATP synthase A1 subunit C [Candidatus Woesearchaeota archaeon]|nr:ATP synthase A1 subunit C [Candidatus Woesearchaeota archaeon]
MQLKYKQENLNLGKYPYTYVRTAVMKSLLFSKEDYHKMLKMGFNEIAKFMQESNYKKEISELASSHSGADLLELALNKNLAYTFKKLIKISPKELGLVVREYAKRKDIEDIKTIIRGKFTNAPEKEVFNSVTSAGTLSREFQHELIKKDSIEQVLKNNRIVSFSLLEKGLTYLKEKNSLALIENSLDRAYFNNLVEFSKLLPQEGALFRRFLVMEVEIMDILTLLRLKKSKIENAGEFIITARGLINPKITKMSELDDFDALINVLEEIQYKKAIDKGVEDFKNTGSLITLETELYKYLLKQSSLLLHQHPLSVDIILGFMLAKDVEIRNLRILIKGKQLGLNEEFIEKQMVF